ncbi:MAG: AAA family ATPase [Spirochaetaceae bacterium]|nr:AAA family ATPase [Spirochaetaceae bacterium]MBQ8560919.1 AAA family ATPase [Spirochaetaceae bacterium]
MTILRNMNQSLFDLLRFYPVVVLTGARQTGKTTLLHSLLTDFTYVTLDLPSVATLAEEDPQAFFQQHPPPVLIDEVQYAPLPVPPHQVPGGQPAAHHGAVRPHWQPEIHPDAERVGEPGRPCRYP